MATAAIEKASERITVVLPVCLECKRVGKIPAGYYGGKEYCAGPLDEGHKKVRMVKRTFELVDDGEQPAPPSRPPNSNKQLNRSGASGAREER
jgi:hypothetical protein